MLERRRVVNIVTRGAERAAPMAVVSSFRPSVAEVRRRVETAQWLTGGGRGGRDILVAGLRLEMGARRES